MYDPQTQAKIDNWKARNAAGEQIPVEEMREAIALLRQGRQSALHASKPTKSPSSSGRSRSSPPRDADDMLKGLLG